MNTLLLGMSLVLAVAMIVVALVAISGRRLSIVILSGGLVSLIAAQDP